MEKNNTTNLSAFFFEFSQDLICITGFNGGFKYINPTWEKLLDYSEKELLLTSFWELIHPEDGLENDTKISILSKENTTINFENRYICKDGLLKYIEWTATSNLEKKEIYFIGRYVPDKNVKVKKYQTFFKENINSNFQIEIKNPVSINLFVSGQVEAIFKESYLVEANNLCLAYFGKQTANELIGQRVSFLFAAQGFLPGDAMYNLYENFVRNNYKVKDYEVAQTLESGEVLWNSINAFGIVKNDCLISIWGSFIDISKRKKREAKLHKNENQFEKLYKNALVALFSIDLGRGKIIRANKVAAHLFGYNTIDELKHSFRSNKHYANPDDRAFILKKIKEKGNIKNVLMHSKKVDGTLFWNEASFSLDKKNDIVVCVSVDVTQRVEQAKQLQRIEKSLIESRNKFEVLSNVNFEGILIHDKGVPVSMNYSFAKMFGYTQEELLDKEIISLLIKKEFQSTFLNNIMNQYSQAYEVIGIKKNGIEFPIEIEGKTYVTENNKRHRVTSFRDVSKRKQSEIELKQSALLLEASQKIAKVGGWELDIATDYLFWTAETYRIHDTSPAEFNPNVDTAIGYFLPESHRIISEAFQAALEKGEPYDLELETYTTKGRRIDVRTTCEVTFKAGKPSKLTGIFQDITARKEREVELIKAKEKAEQSDRLKSAFLANMSHEIRTPMNGIISFTNLLKEPNLSGEEQRDYISIIEKSGNRMLNTIHDIIDISRIESGEENISWSEVNLKEQMKELFAFFFPQAEGKGINLQISNRILNDQITIKSDKTKLNSILTNLIKNAIKFTKHGSIEVGYLRSKSEFEFYVKDTGIGIIKERQKAIFNRFEQADIEDKQVHEGSGLGLAISKAYVEMLGGEIGVQSEIGKGSQFYFTIPRI